MSNRIWVLGTILVSIAIVALGWFLGISPKLAEVDAASVETANVESQNQAQEAIIALLKAQFAQIDETQEELDELQLSIPGAGEVEVFFDKTTVMATEQGIVIDNLTALEAAIYGGSVDPTAATSADTVQPGDATAADPNAPAASLDTGLASRFFTIGISLKVLGSADQVFAFTQALQESERLLLVSDVDFTVDAGNQGATITGFLFVVTTAPTGVQ